MNATPSMCHQAPIYLKILLVPHRHAYEGGIRHSHCLLVWWEAHTDWHTVWVCCGFWGSVWLRGGFRVWGSVIFQWLQWSSYIGPLSLIRWGWKCKLYSRTLDRRLCTNCWSAQLVVCSGLIPDIHGCEASQRQVGLDSNSDSRTATSYRESSHYANYAWPLHPPLGRVDG